MPTASHHAARVTPIGTAARRTHRAAHTPLTLHRGFVMRTYQAEVLGFDGSRFSFFVEAYNQAEAELEGHSRLTEQPKRFRVRCVSDTALTAPTQPSEPVPLDAPAIATMCSTTAMVLDHDAALDDITQALIHQRSEWSALVARDAARMGADAPRLAPHATTKAALEQPAATWRHALPDWIRRTGAQLDALAALYHRAIANALGERTPTGCAGKGCDQGRNPAGCDCALIGRWCTTSDPAEGMPWLGYHTAARQHTSSHLLDDMRMPLRRRDLAMAAAAVALAIAAAVLWAGKGAAPL